MKKTRMYLVRHGETQWNADGRFQGHSDVPLSVLGRSQVETLTTKLSQLKIDAFYSSDLSRAMETAEILAKKHQCQIYYLPDLREINFGEWEGLTFEEIAQNYGELSSQWWANPFTTQIPSGESLQDVAERCAKAVHEIIDRHAGKTVVVAAHGGVIRMIVAHALGMDFQHYWKLRLDNVSLTIVEYHGYEKAILELYNDTCHLKNTPS
ncbi:phosphoglycerate mutase [Desulforamulus reducens MI-1]|uniref:Alpha-ribazole phosphatase n=1 Tax=Desulforamulus reducens (strain ATCC BAA-1160 / DSM 100696 / MI-1) TaxID=349161 RepID=A4J5S6_DESRM|nr:alpha-ribazole phosphatase [Desulforamulus reducens]ABO50429.1 phosphoglycerate mutase [Desulforamulus reducens MI-1]